MIPVGSIVKSLLHASHLWKHKSKESHATEAAFCPGPYAISLDSGGYTKSHKHDEHQAPITFPFNEGTMKGM